MTPVSSRASNCSLMVAGRKSNQLTRPSETMRKRRQSCRYLIGNWNFDDLCPMPTEIVTSWLDYLPDQAISRGLSAIDKLPMVSGNLSPGRFPIKTSNRDLVDPGSPRLACFCSHETGLGYPRTSSLLPFSATSRLNGGSSTNKPFGAFCKSIGVFC